MTKIINSKYKIFRRYGLDLWGGFLTNIRRNKRKKVFKILLEKYKYFFSFRNYRERVLLNRFFSKKRLNKKFRRKPLTMKSRIYYASRRLKYYYGNISKAKMGRIALELRKKKQAIENCFFEKLETRLEVIFYKFNSFSSIWEVRQYVKHGLVTVNGKVIRGHNSEVKRYDIVSVISKKKLAFKKNLFKRLKRNIVVMPNTPPYLEFDIRSFTLIQLDDVRSKNVSYPFFIKKFHRSALISLYRRI
jgi:ribosomal protein S4